MLTVALILATLTLSTSDLRRRGGSVDDVDAPIAVDHGVLERVMLQQARVEAVKRGILQQLGLTEAPRPPSAGNRSSLVAVDGGDVGRSVKAAYRRTVAQTRRNVVSNDVNVVSNDVVDDVTGNDAMLVDAPSARQFYSFKGHGELSIDDRLANQQYRADGCETICHPWWPFQPFPVMK